MWKLHKRKPTLPSTDTPAYGSSGLHYYPDIYKLPWLRRAWCCCLAGVRWLGKGVVRLLGAVTRIPWATWVYGGQFRAKRWAQKGVRRFAQRDTSACHEPVFPRESLRYRRDRQRRTGVSASDRMRLSEEGRSARARHSRLSSPQKRLFVLALAAFVLLVGGVGAAVVYITHRYEVSVVDRGVQTTYVTTKSTVDAFLKEKGILIGNADAVEPALDSSIENGMRVTIYRALPIYIDAAEDSQLVFMQRGTVEDVLDMAGIPYDDMDIIEPAMDTSIYANMRIHWSDIEKMTSLRKDTVKYTVIRRKTDDLLLGKEKVVQSGRDGLVENETVTVYQDGVEIYREVVRESVLVEMKPEIVEVGTKVTPKPTLKPTPKPVKETVPPSQVKPTPKPDAKPRVTTAPKPRVTKKPAATPKPAEKPKVTKKPAGSDNKVPGAPDSFISTMVIGQVTAYTHTGNQVAKGGMPQATRSYEKPGSVAVDPSVIPYGTLLYIPGYGYGLAEDAGPTNSHIDLFMDTRDECKKWGRKRDVEIYIVATKYKR